MNNGAAAAVPGGVTHAGGGLAADQDGGPRLRRLDAHLTCSASCSGRPRVSTPSSPTAASGRVVARSAARHEVEPDLAPIRTEPM